MSFLAAPPSQARKPLAVILPDGRKRLTRWYKATTTGTLPVQLGGTGFTVASADPWPAGETPTGWTGLLLTYIQMDDDARGYPKGTEDHQPLIRLIYEQISATAETAVGNPTVIVNQYGYLEVTYEWVQFSSNAFVPQTVGTTTAASPWGVCVLRDEEAPDDGTLRHIKRTYVEGGQLSDHSNIRFGGKVIVRTLRYLNEVPPTPTGYTLVGPGVEYINGLPVYTYEFVNGGGGGGAGTGGIISDSTEYRQSDDQGTIGVTIRTIEYVTDLSVVSNPISTPSGMTLIDVSYKEETGYKLWTGRYAKGVGLVLDEKNITASAALVIYHRVALGSAPSAPSATIGGTVTLFETSLRNADGYDIYDYRWAEGDGQASITTRGEADGAVIYTITDYSAAASTPSYPGSGTAPLVSLTQKPENGYFTNTAVYHKLPASVGFRKMVKFLYPGLASFSGAPVLYGLIPPVTMDILATVTVDYDTTQVTTTPFTVSAYAKLNVSWIPYTNPGTAPTPGSPPADTTTGPPQGYTESLGGYLAGASGISDDDQYFNGVFVATYSATLSASTPSTRPSGATTIAVDNDPYVISTSGTQYFRRTVTTYSF